MKIKILIADDHRVVVDGLKALLLNVPEFDVVAEANDGREVLETVKHLTIDVILMDIDMPVLNGIEATRRLTQSNPKIKVLVLSMHDEKGIIEKLMEVGACGYVLKNVNKSELVSAIKKVHAGEKYFCGSVAFSLLKKDSAEVISTSISHGGDSLSRREIEILRLIAKGFSSTDIGKKLFISPRTVDTHRSHLIEKLQVKNIAGLISYAIQNGYLK